ncbi:HAMP domain-containing sensor histidine kinase [Bradyrhizobium sp. NP1]|uniref:sensor histidine kinase n=1 Tax=Bradyrhizobium sp. NP1 TaxID=3049772 RepID=UPI0025A6558D|nr:HAMP domain-containing sensor histidine kinase [Bradyrhizobium sp. NP1]WJR76695.1 cache domain-containing protein [Bradyrhizobium sp. NP1]
MYKVMPASGRRSVRYRLLAIALLPMLVILPLLLAITIYRWNAKFDAALISKVNGDLTIAHQYLARILESTEQQLVSVGESARFRDLLAGGGSVNEGLAALLTEKAQALRFDFLYLVGDDGRIIAGARPIGSSSVRWDWPVIRAALGGQARTGIDIFDSADLAAISPELAQRARLELIPANDIADAGRTLETRGMVIHSASALLLPDGRRAALVGGMLLNRNLGFIDTINDLVYHDAGLPEGSRGTATLFLDDVRISTNVRLFEGRRALGTRVSAAVRAAVLDQGRTWLGSAFVVSDWYISGYEPIIDSYGRRAGMLYVGFLEQPFTEAKHQALLGIAAAFLVAAAATVPLFLKWASGIFRPLERMTGTIARVESGDLAARTGDVESKDEIGQVALHLDHLLDQVQERDTQLRQWNEELNRRVEERALRLQQANLQLETTTRQLVMSEKLAAIGEITAGVAHEINNPIAVMQGNLEVIRDLMGEKAEAARTEFRLIDEQMHRISEIVTKLLQFAKPQEYAGYLEPQAVADIVSDTLPLVQHLLKKTTIAVEREDSASRLVLMNRTELQQVLVNLIVNAIHAMLDGGRLAVRTFDQDLDGRPGVVIEVADTGAGMTPEVMQRIFDPFFTTKRREGTGLGLSVSQMLVTRQGGRISVASKPGKGTTFTVWLPEVS